MTFKGDPKEQLLNEIKLCLLGPQKEIMGNAVDYYILNRKPLTQPELLIKINNLNIFVKNVTDICTATAEYTYAIKHQVFFTFQAVMNDKDIPKHEGFDRYMDETILELQNIETKLNEINTKLLKCEHYETTLENFLFAKHHIQALKNSCEVLKGIYVNYMTPRKMIQTNKNIEKPLKQMASDTDAKTHIYDIV